MVSLTFAMMIGTVLFGFGYVVGYASLYFYNKEKTKIKEENKAKAEELTKDIFTIAECGNYMFGRPEMTKYTSIEEVKNELNNLKSKYEKAREEAEASKAV